MRIQYSHHCYFSYLSSCLYKKTGNNQDNHTVIGHTDSSKHILMVCLELSVCPHASQLVQCYSEGKSAKIELQETKGRSQAILIGLMTHWIISTSGFQMQG